MYIYMMDIYILQGRSMVNIVCVYGGGGGAVPQKNSPLTAKKEGVFNFFKN